MASSVTCIKFFLMASYMLVVCGDLLPVVLNTWSFKVASDKAYEVMEAGQSSLDAVVKGITVCELKPCAKNPLNPNVGFGGKPNEEGETTQDAMIMDGVTHASAAVGCIKRIKNAIGVARAVMKYTKHSLLVGQDATNFAKRVGFPEEDLHTNNSRKTWNDWKNKKCQPNFWKPIVSGANNSCGPYNFPSRAKRQTHSSKLRIDDNNHDTIGMVAVDANGNVASGTSTNGLGFKIAGRVGDSPIAGAGSYADNDVGAAAATGNGDVMTRFLPTYQAVEFMRQGYSPEQASQLALLRIVKHYKDFIGALIAVNKKGEYGGATYNYNQFIYSVRTPRLGESKLIKVAPLDPTKVIKERPCTASNGTRISFLPWTLLPLFLYMVL